MNIVINTTLMIVSFVVGVIVGSFGTLLTMKVVFCALGRC